MSCFGNFDNLLYLLGFKTEEQDVVTEIPVEKKKRKFFRRRKNGDKKKRKKRRQKGGRLRRFMKRKSTNLSSSSAETVASELSTSSDDCETNEKELQRRFPQSTFAERKRFLQGRTLIRATEKMDIYMKWRNDYDLDRAKQVMSKNRQGVTDEDTWDFAVNWASKQSKQSLKQEKSLPRIVKFGRGRNDLRTKDSKRLVQVLPGMIDKKMAPLEFYALCVAIYLDMKLDRNSDESIYILVDVRAGVGWPNGSPTSLIPFVKNLIRILSDTMPERMCQTHVFPIPTIAKPIWSIYKKSLDEKLVKKVNVFWGAANADSPLPKSLRFQCSDSLTSKLLQALEESRFDEFLL